MMLVKNDTFFFLKMCVMCTLDLGGTFNLYFIHFYTVFIFIIDYFWYENKANENISMLEKIQGLFHSNFAMLKAMLFNKEKKNALATISTNNFENKTARNQVIIRVVIIVNIYCMLNLHQA